MPWELAGSLLLAVVVIGTIWYLVRRAPATYVKHRAEMQRDVPAGECHLPHCRKPAELGLYYCSTQHEIDADWQTNA